MRVLIGPSSVEGPLPILDDKEPSALYSDRRPEPPVDSRLAAHSVFRVQCPFFSRAADHTPYTLLGYKLYAVYGFFVVSTLYMMFVRLEATAILASLLLFFLFFLFVVVAS